MNLMQESLRPIKDKLADAVSSCLDAALCEAGIMFSGHPGGRISEYLHFKVVVARGWHFIGFLSVEAMGFLIIMKEGMKERTNERMNE